MRIQRILAHLNVVGFREYAKKLVEFLEKEIYGSDNTFESYSNQSFNKITFENAPLKDLAKSEVFQKWKDLGEDYNDPKKIEALELNSLAKYPEDFKPSLYFSQSNEANQAGKFHGSVWSLYSSQDSEVDNKNKSRYFCCCDCSIF